MGGLNWLLNISVLWIESEVDSAAPLIADSTGKPSKKKVRYIFYFLFPCSYEEKTPTNIWFRFLSFLLRSVASHLNPATTAAVLLFATADRRRRNATHPPPDHLCSTSDHRERLWYCRYCLLPLENRNLLVCCCYQKTRETKKNPRPLCCENPKRYKHY